MSARYLIEASNSMIGSLKYLEKGDIDPESLRQFFSIGCAALNNILNDQILKEHLKNNLVKDFQGEIKRSRIAMGDFLSTFIRFEKGLMLEAGMDPKMVNYLFQDAKNITTTILSDDFHGYDDIENRLKDITGTVCALSTDGKVDSSYLKYLKGTVYIVGGISILGVNLTIDTSTSFLFLVSSGSGLFGKCLASEGIRQCIKN